MFSRIHWTQTFEQSASLRIKSPVHGYAKPAVTACSSLFASGFFGDGIWVELQEQQIVAPFSATFTRQGATGQCLSWQHISGLTLQLHFPPQASELCGQGFLWSTPEECTVKPGQLIAKFNAELLSPPGQPFGVFLKLVEHPKINKIMCRAGYHQAFKDDLLAVELKM